MRTTNRVFKTRGPEKTQKAKRGIIKSTSLLIARKTVHSLWIFGPPTPGPHSPLALRKPHLSKTPPSPFPFFQTCLRIVIWRGNFSEVLQLDVYIIRHRQRNWPSRRRMAFRIGLAYRLFDFVGEKVLVGLVVVI